MSSGVCSLLKKEFASVDVAVIVREMKEAILNSRINNVYQLDEKTLLLKLHKTGVPPLRLVLEAGRRLHLTSYAVEKPLTPPAFCMALRKYLRSAWLTGVEQFEFERIVGISLRTKTGVMHLILELFGEGNLILTGEKGEIVQALIFKSMRDRSIQRNEIYKFPPSLGKNPFKLTLEEFEKNLKESGEVEVVRSMARALGLGGVYAEEVLSKAKIEKTRKSNALTNEQVKSIFDCLQELLKAVSSEKLEPRIVLDDNGSFLDVTPFALDRYAASKVQSYGSFNEALDEFYVRATVAQKAVVSSGLERLKKEAQRLQRIVSEQEQLFKEAEAKAEVDKWIGNVIYAHSSELQTLLDKFSAEKNQDKDWNSVVSQVLNCKNLSNPSFTLFDSFDTRNLAININVDNLKFSMSLRKTLFENAAEFYDRGKKNKQKSAGALAALEESRRKLAEAQDRMTEAETMTSLRPAEAMDELVRLKIEAESKEWYEKFRWFTSSEGFLVVGGKDAVSNEVLVKKHTEPPDPVFHADIMGAPFVVVKTNKKEPGEQTLKEASEFAVSFSRAWRENMGSSDVYWVKPDQLSKSGPSGESVAHGAFVVNGKRNWMRNVPLRLSIGLILDEATKFVGGPVDSIKAKTKNYVIIAPGDATGKDLLKQILRTLTLKLPKEHRERIGKTSIEQIREFVPFTKGRLLNLPP
jgi:predicted ribosome quality control (RQC) complex YloA/Tae2 family protein